MSRVGGQADVSLVDGAPGGGRIVRLVVDGSVREALEAHGRVPLPPYLERDDEPLDRERYQPVYARVPGSVAAPTAGLHFTPELLEMIDAKGVERVAVTLDEDDDASRADALDTDEGLWLQISVAVADTWIP